MIEDELKPKRQKLIENKNMSNYKKISTHNIKSIDFGDWELKDIINKNDSKNISVAIIVHKGNEVELHHSDLSDRIYFVILGKGKFHFKNEIVNVGEGDLIYIPKNVSYCSVGQDNFTCLSVLSPAFDQEYEIVDKD